ncbi:MAG: ABC transporter ATP-binding protein [Oscillospiraceae bacterium]|nr:ABC transporter ATP-binding protein [Oscillospiraceae bacterium]MBR2978036.1 ABC transporter ATP-binding protein [Oscillospiraceae bacterium]
MARFSRFDGNPNYLKDTKGGKPRLRQPKRKTMLRLWQYLGKERRLMISALILMLLESACSLVGPKLSGMAINAIGDTAGGVDFRSVYIFCGLMLVMYVLVAVFNYLVNRTTLLLSRRVSYQLRRDVFNKLTTLPVGYFDVRQTGDILSVISYDIDTVHTSLAHDVLQIVVSFFTIVFSIVMMASILPKLLLVFCVTVPISVLFVRFITKYVRTLFRKRSICMGEMNGYAEEMVGGQKTIRAYGRQKQIIDGFRKKNDAAAMATAKATGCASATGATMMCMSNLSQAMVSIFGGLMLFRGIAALGDIAAFIQYARRFNGPINEISTLYGDLQAAFAAAERVFELLDEEPEKADEPDAVELADVRGDVVMQDVEFGYTPDRRILHGLDLHAPPGSLLAIVGPTGAGKTTIINLLMRFYDVDSGEIRVDGNETRRLTRSSLRGAYSMVLQETWLFHGTVFENIAYGKQDATMEEVVAAAKAAGIHRFIMSLPKGYDTVLKFGGTGISKGQKQMLTIARAMLCPSKMLILDESTSNVDTQTERRIQSAMRELMKDRTCFVIAHRLSTIRHADNILVVRDGNVVEQGTHEQLMEQRGFYRKLYESQFEGVDQYVRGISNDGNTKRRHV